MNSKQRRQQGRRAIQQSALTTIDDLQTFLRKLAAPRGRLMQATLADLRLARDTSVALAVRQRAIERFWLSVPLAFFPALRIGYMPYLSILISPNCSPGKTDPEYVNFYQSENNFLFSTTGLSQKRHHIDNITFQLS